MQSSRGDTAGRGVPLDAPWTLVIVVQAELRIPLLFIGVWHAEPLLMEGASVDPLGRSPLDALYHRTPRVHGCRVALPCRLQAVEEQRHACTATAHEC